MTPRFSRRSLLNGGLGAAGAIAAGTFAFPVENSAQEASLSPGLYFAETGHNLRNVFLERWRMAGGQDTLGSPLSEERFEEDLGIVQSFDTVTLVFDPGLSAPWDVQGTPLSEEFIQDLAPASALKPVETCDADSVFCQYFPETGHTISGPFVSLWSVAGDLPVLGFPVSEPFKERSGDATVQVFEKAVIEDHPRTGTRLRPIAREASEEAGLLATLPFLPAPPTAGDSKLVSAPDGLRLRQKPMLDSDIVVTLPDNAEFITPFGSTGDWLPGYADGYSGWVFAEFLADPPPLPEVSLEDWDVGIWQGATLSETNVRGKPTTDAPIVEVLPLGSSLEVSDWVEGEEVFQGADLWSQIGASKFVYARNVGRSAPVMAPPLPEGVARGGRWIDVNLTQQLMTAYEDVNPVRVAVTTTGMAGWETPEGTFSVLTRVPNETMTSGSIGAEHFYKLEDVLFTQYFTNEGHAIHFAWWRTPVTIGRPGSHGCLNLLLDDSQFFWEWSDIGTVIQVRS